MNSISEMSNTNCNNEMKEIKMTHDNNKDSTVNYSCSICLVDFDKLNLKDIILFSNCSHYICLSCFEEYKKHHTSCPICRNVIDYYALVKGEFVINKSLFYIENNTCIELKSINNKNCITTNEKSHILYNVKLDNSIYQNEDEINQNQYIDKTSDNHNDLVKNEINIDNNYKSKLEFIKFIKPDVLFVEESFQSITKDEINLEIKLLENILMKIHIDLFGRWNSKNELFKTSFYNKTLSILEEVKGLNLENGKDNHYEHNKKILELIAICSTNVDKLRKNEFSSEDKLEILKNDEDLFALSIPNPTNFEVIKKKKIRRGSS